MSAPVRERVELARENLETAGSIYLQKMSRLGQLEEARRSWAGGVESAVEQGEDSLAERRIEEGRGVFVTGDEASRMAEEYSCPTFLICLDGDKGKGSCRSYGGFNLFDALSACSEYLEGFGGHALAAGLNIKRDKLRQFCRAFSEYYENNKPTELPTLCCDCLLYTSPSPRDRG